MKKALKSILNWIIFLLTGKGEIVEEAEKEGICKFDGQK